MKDGSTRSVSGPAPDSAASEGQAAGADSFILDDTPPAGARGATTEWTKAFTGSRTAGTGGDRIADHAYGGDLFSQRGDYKEGEQTAAAASTRRAGSGQAGCACVFVGARA